MTTMVDILEVLKVKIELGFADKADKATFDTIRYDMLRLAHCLKEGGYMKDNAQGIIDALTKGGDLPEISTRETA